MKIFVKNDDGKVYEAFQVDENTYKFKAENKTFELSLTESEEVDVFSASTEKRKKNTTKVFFSNEDVLEQLREARKNRHSDFSYYSGDEVEFNKLVDEINSDR
ncbi:hypothetical protein GH741_00800 [Aquibacillus halophilus]|uniref:Uncharacterized protein n=1 Tax=Aquibacillus halophilus TaxID=930132 RepID=A0A6A8D7F4_9BACI|nr:hypothetical protein [Aquibacillus halophilus]MRH41210.1 hypothetical protein [Aquibacillus halophilus]